MSCLTIRFNGLDILRALCVFAVVWIHGCDTSSVALRFSGFARFAVPSFILMSFFLFQLSVLNSPQQSIRTTLIRRLSRLLPPYLFWSLAYLAVRQLKHSVQGSPLVLEEWFLALWTGGASYQLYFVAAMVYWTLFFIPLFYLGRQRNAMSSFLLLVFGGVLLWAGAWMRSRVESTPGIFLWPQMLGLTGYVPLAMAFSRLWFSYGKSAANSIWLRRTGYLSGILALGWMVARIPAGRVLVPSLGLFAWGLLSRPKQVSFVVNSISQLSYGIFLVHGFFVEGFQMLAIRMDWPLNQFPLTLSVILLSFVCSYLLCDLIFRVRKLRWLVT